MSSINFEVEGHTVPHLKALKCGTYDSRGLSCGSIFNICQDVLKIGNLLHKGRLVDSQMVTTAIDFITSKYFLPNST